ncbi:MAG TPA: type II toxin-antitoxin system prevent-host-death family antitoxin [Caulobacteraceae bacterium]|jgi:prevent-host-death family protein|nr:type II toxin-antitoxin system prevent-host-death family antitoxin [Caulobacteraceae bacterium]
MSDLVVPAAEANRSFSKLLREVRAGRRVTITSHGEPVAVLAPVGDTEAIAADRERRRQAQAELEAHWAGLEPIIVGPWTREELHERG